MKLFTHIKSLLQTRESIVSLVNGKSMNELPAIENAWLAVKDGRIEDFGSMDALDHSKYADYEEMDASGRLLLPTWVDSHTHLVFAEWRDREFEDRIQGLTYQEIAKRGGGILNSVRKLRNASEEDLYNAAMDRLDQLIKQGTGAIEIKSGYGLSEESEVKMLKVIQRIKENAPIPVKSTFLGAHAVPEEFADDPDGYVNHLIEKLLPRIVDEGLADYVDAFCEEGYFSVAHIDRLLEAASKRGLRSKVHVNQFNAMGGIATCVKHNALSVDHLEVLTKGDLEQLKGSNTLPVALPGCSFFLGIPYTPVRELMDADLPVVLASDFNPGSAPSGNLNFALSLACVKMKMTPAEAVNALTLNGAAALELSSELGSITKGKRANLILTEKVSGLAYLPYNFGGNNIQSVYINGERYF